MARDLTGRDIHLHIDALMATNAITTAPASNYLHTQFIAGNHRIIFRPCCRDSTPRQTVLLKFFNRFRDMGLLIAVYHTSSVEVFATQHDCPHRGGPLADGLIGGTTVICPLHDRSFDLRTGKNLSGDCIYLRTYPVTLKQDGRIAFQIEWA